MLSINLQPLTWAEPRRTEVEPPGRWMLPPPSGCPDEDEGVTPAAPLFLLKREGDEPPELLDCLSLLPRNRVAFCKLRVEGNRLVPVPYTIFDYSEGEQQTKGFRKFLGKVVLFTDYLLSAPNNSRFLAHSSSSLYFCCMFALQDIGAHGVFLQVFRGILGVIS